VLYDQEPQIADDVKAAEGKPPPFRFTGDGLGALAPLMVSGLVEISKWAGGSYFGGGTPSFEVQLTDRGRRLVEAWRAGDPGQIKAVLELPRDSG
jgi:hypothetical protein